LRRQLIDDSVSERIGEWQAKLKQVGSRLFEREGKIDRPFQARIAGANIRNEAFAPGRTQLREAIVDPVFHE